MVPYERCMRAVLTYIGAPARSRAGASPYLLTLSAQKLRCKLSCAALDELPRDLVLPPFEEVLDGEWVVRGAERFEEGVHGLLGHRGRDRHRWR